jgi:outer membrane biosynthesis protein TonB
MPTKKKPAAKKPAKKAPAKKAPAKKPAAKKPAKKVVVKKVVAKKVVSKKPKPAAPKPKAPPRKAKKDKAVPSIKVIGASKSALNAALAAAGPKSGIDGDIFGPKVGSAELTGILTAIGGFRGKSFVAWTGESNKLRVKKSNKPSNLTVLYLGV